MEKINNGIFKKELLSQPLFDSLKSDYVGFEKWFINACKDNSKRASYITDGSILKAFFGYKTENEPFEELSHETKHYNKDDLNKPRIKITTLKADNDLKRMSEFAIMNAYTLALKTNANYIYLTMIEDTKDKVKLGSILRSHGFVNIGHQLPHVKNRKNNEIFYVKFLKTILWNENIKHVLPLLPKKPSRMNLDVFPLIIRDKYHDTMFQLSELQNVVQNRQHDLTVSHSIKKTFLHKNKTIFEKKSGDIGLVYRQYTGTNHPKKYRSCITGVTYVLKQEKISDFKSFEAFKSKFGDTVVFKEEELKKWYKDSYYITSLMYVVGFGLGSNQATYDYLIKSYPHFDGVYPSSWFISDEIYQDILIKKGGLNVWNFITD